MNRIFLVRIRGSDLCFSEEKFWEFCKKARSHDWFFWYGEIDSNEPLKSPKQISIKELPHEFDMEKVKPLLKYKTRIYGTTMINDMPFFSKRVYEKYGERIAWNDKY